MLRLYGIIIHHIIGDMIRMDAILRFGFEGYSQCHLCNIPLSTIVFDSDEWP